MASVTGDALGQALQTATGSATAAEDLQILEGLASWRAKSFRDSQHRRSQAYNQSQPREGQEDTQRAQRSFLERTFEGGSPYAAGMTGSEAVSNDGYQSVSVTFRAREEGTVPSYTKNAQSQASERFPASSTQSQRSADFDDTAENVGPASEMPLHREAGSQVRKPHEELVQDAQVKATLRSGSDDLAPAPQSVPAKGLQPESISPSGVERRKESADESSEAKAQLHASITEEHSNLQRRLSEVQTLEEQQAEKTPDTIEEDRSKSRSCSDWKTDDLLGAESDDQNVSTQSIENTTNKGPSAEHSEAERVSDDELGHSHEATIRITPSPSKPSIDCKAMLGLSELHPESPATRRVAETSPGKVPVELLQPDTPATGRNADGALAQALSEAYLSKRASESAASDSLKSAQGREALSERSGSLHSAIGKDELTHDESEVSSNSTPDKLPDVISEHETTRDTTPSSSVSGAQQSSIVPAEQSQATDERPEPIAPNAPRNEADPALYALTNSFLNRQYDQALHQGSKKEDMPPGLQSPNPLEPSKPSRVPSEMMTQGSQSSLEKDEPLKEPFSSDTSVRSEDSVFAERSRQQKHAANQSETFSPPRVSREVELENPEEQSGTQSSHHDASQSRSMPKRCGSPLTHRAHAEYICPWITYKCNFF